MCNDSSLPLLGYCPLLGYRLTISMPDSSGYAIPHIVSTQIKPRPSLSWASFYSSGDFASHDTTPTCTCTALRTSMTSISCRESSMGAVYSSHCTSLSSQSIGLYKSAIVPSISKYMAHTSLGWLVACRHGIQSRFNLSFECLLLVGVIGVKAKTCDYPRGLRVVRVPSQFQ